MTHLLLSSQRDDYYLLLHIRRIGAAERKSFFFLDQKLRGRRAFYGSDCGMRGISLGELLLSSKGSHRRKNKRALSQNQKLADHAVLLFLIIF